MTEQQMLDNLIEIKKNLSFNGNREMYAKMLIELETIHYFLHSDLQIDYWESLSAEEIALLERDAIYDF